METHYFTCGQLLDVLAELEAITDNKLFVNRIFSIIHHEVITVSYLNAPHQYNDDAHLGDNLLMVGLEQAKRDAKNKLLKYCYSIKETDDVALSLLKEAQEAKTCIENINLQSKKTPFWQVNTHIALRKTKKEILQKHIPFSDVGSLFLHMYVNRGIGEALTFRYNLIRYSRHVSKEKKDDKEDKKNIGFHFKKLFNNSSTVSNFSSSL